MAETVVFPSPGKTTVVKFLMEVQEVLVVTRTLEQAQDFRICTN